MSLDNQSSLTSRVGAISAAATGASLIVSAFYDWGFFFSLGISFAEAPTTIDDHLRSWLVWLPKVSLIILGPLLVEMLTRRVEKGMTEEEIVASAPDPQRTEKSRERPLYFLVVVAVIGIISWLLFGGPLMHSAFWGGVILWFAISYWIFSHPLVSQRHPKWFHSIFYWIPPILALSFYFGFSSTNSIMKYDFEATHKLQLENVAADVRLMNVSILRHFERYLLARNQDGIMWVKTDKVRVIQQTTEIPFFAGIVCYYRESSCPWLQAIKPAE